MKSMHDTEAAIWVFTWRRGGGTRRGTRGGSRGGTRSGNDGNSSTVDRQIVFGHNLICGGN